VDPVPDLIPPFFIEDVPEIEAANSWLADHSANEAVK
jgi:hypothetical protein